MKKIFAVMAMISAITTCGGNDKTAVTESKSTPKIGVAIYKFDDNFMAILR